MTSEIPKDLRKIFNESFKLAVTEGDANAALELLAQLSKTPQEIRESLLKMIISKAGICVGKADQENDKDSFNNQISLAKGYIDIAQALLNSSNQV